ncbi:gltX2, partial [Symbiodinium sp. CCMP2456]
MALRQAELENQLLGLGTRPLKFGHLDAPRPDEIQLEHVLQGRAELLSGKTSAWMSQSAAMYANKNREKELVPPDLSVDRYLQLSNQGLIMLDRHMGEMDHIMTGAEPEGDELQQFDGLDLDMDLIDEGGADHITDGLTSNCASPLARGNSGLALTMDDDDDFADDGSPLSPSSRLSPDSDADGLLSPVGKRAARVRRARMAGHLSNMQKKATERREEEAKMKRQRQELLEQKLKAEQLPDELTRTELNTTWVSPGMKSLYVDAKDRDVMHKTRCESFGLKMSQSSPLITSPSSPLMKSSRSSRSVNFGETGASKEEGDRDRGITKRGSTFARIGVETLILEPPANLSAKVVYGRLDAASKASQTLSFANYTKEYDAPWVEGICPVFHLGADDELSAAEVASDIEVPPWVGVLEGRIASRLAPMQQVRVEANEAAIKEELHLVIGGWEDARRDDAVEEAKSMFESVDLKDAWADIWTEFLAKVGGFGGDASGGGLELEQAAAAATAKVTELLEAFTPPLSQVCTSSSLLPLREMIKGSNSTVAQVMALASHRRGSGRTRSRGGKQSLVFMAARGGESHDALVKDLETRGLQTVEHNIRNVARDSRKQLAFAKWTALQSAKSDKSLGVVALTFFDLRAKGKIGDRIAMVGTNGDKEPKIKEHFSRNLTFPNIGSKEFEFFPKEGKNPKAYLDAIKAFKPGDVCTVFTPDDTHFEICKAALQGGVHVLVTKPMVKTLAQHKELVRLVPSFCPRKGNSRPPIDPSEASRRRKESSYRSRSTSVSIRSTTMPDSEFRTWVTSGPVACSSTACRTPLRGAPPVPAAQHRDGYAACSSGKARPVVTRFAPSPTGYLHIGGARTALFNYLFARHHGGKFLMRIEDTDAERHNEAAVDAILQGMAWLGTPHDGEIVRQRENIGRHKEVAAQLLANGGAYKCYCSKEELEAMRAQAEKEHVPFRYSGPWRNAGPDLVPPPDRQPVVRIRTPDDDGVTSWQDGVMGLIEIPNKDVDDFIILRADGTPTYLLAVVVDDHDMGVTQVIRGSDHIGNTARQISVFKNMGWELPDFAHLPLIHGPDGKKLSKRHGATGLEEFEAKGYLPESIRNYLARLSWSHGDDEIFSTEQ